MLILLSFFDTDLFVYCHCFALIAAITTSQNDADGACDRKLSILRQYFAKNRQITAINCSCEQIKAVFCLISVVFQSLEKHFTAYF